MGWYYQSIEDMEVAIKKFDWKTVRKILKNHRIPPLKRIENELAVASNSLTHYYKHMWEIFKIVSSWREEKLKGLRFQDELLLNAEEAKKHIKDFEEIIATLKKQGKTLE